MEAEYRYYNSSAWKIEERCELLPGWGKRIPADLIQIGFQLYKASRTEEVTEDGYPNPIHIRYDHDPQQPLLVADVFQPMISREKLLSNKPVYVERYKNEILSAKFGVPECKHAAIIRKIFVAIETAVRMKRIRVHVVEGTARLHGVTQLTDTSMVIRRDQLITYRLIRDEAIFDRQFVSDLDDRTSFVQVIRQVQRPSNETTSVKLHKYNIPTSKSSIIESLEMVGLEESLKLAATTDPQQENSWSCPICLKGAFEFDNQDLESDEEEAAAAVEGEALQLTRLPCFHIFHRKCIARWLQTSHFCPMCRCAIPQAIAIRKP